MESILIPAIPLYQMCGLELEGTLQIVKRLAVKKRKVIFVVTHELKSYPQLNKTLHSLLRYKPMYFSFAFHASHNDKYYLDSVINRDEKYKLNANKHALLIQPEKYEYEANGDNRYLFKIKSMMDLNSFINRQGST